ncbi:MAG TPA: hypothetical protein VFW73_00285, partial [Lacipirellulaceae bacterium]|nr:hypothetical protein [Lacipirellulaceae bacterium]
MTIRRASVILPSHGYDEFPTHLIDEAATNLLVAVTALWHPLLIHAIQGLPGWHSADSLPDPTKMEGELVLLPTVSQDRMATDWCDRFRATLPRNPPLVVAVPSRRDTVKAVLSAASISSQIVSADSVADFLALGFAHLQVELLTRALRYTSVLDQEQFTGAVVAAADAAVAGNLSVQRDELSRAFDLLSDARNHVYSVDFYVVDVTLLADTTLGEALQHKLASGSETNLLVTGELIEKMAHAHPQTLIELRRSLEAGAACIVGGMYHRSTPACRSPEGLISELRDGQQAARQYLEREYEIFGQFEAEFSALLPTVLKSLGFRGALHAAFDGSRLPRADQRKTNWGSGEGSTIEALSATPLDVSRPETWLKFAEHVSDTIAHDHVATILLAGWPGAASEFFDDLRRAARYGAVLGKLITLDAYFRDTREPDSWTNFAPAEYPIRPGTYFGANPISARVLAYRRDVNAVQVQIGSGLAAAAGFTILESTDAITNNSAVINCWNLAHTQIVGIQPLEFGESSSHSGESNALYLPDVPGCGYATVASASAVPPVMLVKGDTLRNEWMELTVSKKTGGIQSLRRHRDRNTRVSQRLVFHHETGDSPAETQMAVDKIQVTRNEPLIGEIVSRGRLLGAGRELLARFTQRVRAVRGMPTMIVDIELDPEHLPAGDIWKSYIGSRLAWAENTLAVRRGVQWVGRETSRECIETTEWVELDDGIGRITCFALGLPFHRMVTPTRMDALLLVAGEEKRRFQFALGLDMNFPTHVALGLLGANRPVICAPAHSLS